ncbi:Cof-type HAD-IIB family hydrolase [Leptolyngbya ohadii]|uniref:Cof-type HAD-IIB family hydrolase n=1 Tax=Leptolyngbya ohadii TaxID=1962290 RepID=UPI000B59DB79|nr:Cof-type HAD-IIB family hydrolase [Leptolyngbya ohadii]
MLNPSLNLTSTPAVSPTANPTQIRLIAIDLDGTTVGESNQMTPAVKQAIQAARAQGVQVAIATGRMFQSALRFYEAIGLTLPMLTYQGALIKDPTTEQIYRHLTVSRQSALNLLDYFEQPELRDLLSIHFYINDSLYVRQITPETELYAQRSQIQPHAVGDLRKMLVDHEPTKILALCDDPDVIDRLLSSLRQQYTPAELYFTKSVATFFEATHPQVNKGTAIQYLAEEMLGLRPENVMAIGDNFNDLEMIQYAGIGVAMGNAPDPVKAAANWVAPNVELDGAAAAIERFVLNVR